MGNFYANITLKASRDEVVPVLAALRRDAYVAFAEGFAIVCDRACDGMDLDVLASLSLTLSTRLSRPVVTVLNFHDDALLFGLYADGALASEYGVSRMAGVTAPTPSKSEFVRRVREAMGTSPVARTSAVPWWIRPFAAVFLAVLRHEQIAAELGLPAASVGAGFKYIDRDDAPKVKKADCARV